MKLFIPALLTAMMATSGAYAQSIGIGPGGVQIDPRTPRDRAIERDIRREDRARERYRDQRSRSRRLPDRDDSARDAPRRSS